ncbi:MAG: PaaI family thioesterase [Acidobacteriota bacterium]
MEGDQATPRKPLNFGEQRERVSHWYDPAIYRQAIGEGRFKTGREMLQAIVDGELPPPPIAATLGYRAAEFGDGEATFTMVPTESHYSPLGMVHGGVFATLLDTSMACAIHTRLPINVPYTTVELKVNYVRPMKIETGEVRCSGKVVHLGRSTAIAEGRILDGRDRLIAHATTTCLILDPISG